MATRQFAALSGAAITRPGWGAVRVGMVVAGSIFLAAIAAMVVGGAYLTVAYWPHLPAFLGLLLILVAIGLRPRLGRLDKDSEPLARQQATALFALVEKVADELGTPRPHIIVLDERFNASCSTVGLRRRHVLRLGLPLWAALPPQQRVALLGHELGHLANGDMRRGILTGIPLGTLAALDDVTRPYHVIRRSHGDIAVAAAIARLLLGVVNRFVWCGYVLTAWITLRDGQKAEYLADQLAARVAGTTAAAGLIDTLAASDGITTALLAAARRGGTANAWRAAADQTRQALAERIDQRRQLSVRDQSSLFATHPPAGLRARLIESRPETPPSVELSEADSDRIDEELAQRYSRLQRNLVHA
ncbi:M48 family metalloprotease [Rugosimonospora africana]|uniref:M48 family metalloprotease n=1 Tax=Rugosimonospora africana TaxID=556532 RepID=UPI00194242E4|nr:M48 family metallopeptidase [Rugosimonospora africana]